MHRDYDKSLAILLFTPLQEGERTKAICNRIILKKDKKVKLLNNILNFKHRMNYAK